MSITVKIPQQPEKLGIKEDIKLKIRKTMGNQLVVEDHPDVDIVIYPDSNKILALAKHRTNEEVYDTQDRLFLLLRNEGVIKPESVHSGFVYGSMEGEMFVNENHDMIQVALLVLINLFLKKDLTLNTLKNLKERLMIISLNPHQKTVRHLERFPKSQQRVQSDQGGSEVHMV